MSEGHSHALLVRTLVEYVKGTVNSEFAPLFVDQPGGFSELKPPKIGGYFPDLYAGSNPPIVGEAKTFRDLDTPHSTLQIAAFMSFASRAENRRFILAVPLLAKNHARSIIRWMVRDLNITSGRFEIICPNTEPDSMCTFAFDAKCSKC